MKLRHAVLLLILANGLYWGWSHGLLRALGLGPAVQTDPSRMTNQIAADAVSVRAYTPPVANTGAAGAARTPAPAGGADAQPADGGASPASPPAAGAPVPEPAGSGAAPAGPASSGLSP